MPKGQLYMNDIDVYEQYGVSMDNNALSTLMQLPERKDWVKNECRTENGTQYLISEPPKVKERELTLFFHMYATSESDFMTKYNAFANFLTTSGQIAIKTSFQPTVVYRVVYISCTQYTQFRREYANIGIKFVEPNPNNR